MTRERAQHRCGDAGGRTASGKSCRRRTSPGERCAAHHVVRRATLGDGTVALVTDQLGRVTREGNQFYLCELGVAVRLGLGDVSPEAARRYFPAFELLPTEERPEPGEVVERVPVFSWLAQAAAAELVRVSTRHLQNLEDRGLPSRGARASKRYPLPHLSVWHEQYQAEIARRGQCRALPFSIAWARHRLDLQELEGDG